ncbi:MAG: acyl--CoA ligase [Eubacterium sp.]|nr:acyl--CoA ligase [Eubacterium sp.]
MRPEQIKALKEKVLKITQPGEIEKHFEIETPYNRFKSTANEFPNNNALLYFGNSFTYKESLAIVDIMAKGFAEIGIKRNDVVTVSLLATPYAIMAFYALTKIGAILHLVNCSASIAEIEREMSNFTTKFFVANDIFCSAEMRTMLKSLGIEKIVATSLLDGMPKNLNEFKIKYAIVEKLKGIKKQEFDGVNLLSMQQILDIGKTSNLKIISTFEPNTMATIAYTSGSTGDSKAVVATNEAIDSMVYMIGLTEETIKPGDVAFTSFPLWIYYSLVNMIHEPLNLGAAIAVDPLFDPKNFTKINKIYKFNHWQTIPPYIKSIVQQHKKTDCSRWKRILTGGDALADEIKILADKYIKENGGTATVEQGYGATEVLGGFAYCYNENPTLGSVGIPAIGSFVKVLDIDSKEKLKCNETGVAYIHTPTLMKEYYGNPEATAHNLVTDENGVVWYNTEDLVHVNERGEIFLDGRIRRIVLTLDKEGNPTKIIPDRVKKELLHNDAVDKCEVITIPDSVKENVAVAFVVKSAEVSKEELLAYCAANVPEYMVPVDIVFIDDIPLTPAKKPDLKALENTYQEKK